MSENLALEKYFNLFSSRELLLEIGKVTKVIGNVIEGTLPGAALGSICEIHPLNGLAPFQTEVIGFKDKSILMMPLGSISGVGLGSRMVLSRSSSTTHVGSGLLGRVIDGLGRPIDGKGPIEFEKELPIYKPVRNPLERPPIRKSLDLGVRAINGLLTVGRGQRVGIMAGSGVGKSVLMGMLAQYTEADVNVIALVGERGREVREFIEHDLGPEGLKRSVVIVATGDESPLIRMRAAFVATTIAEYFSELGNNVLMMMDSVTRFAMAQREIGLSAGEPPASKGYTPSVFSTLPKLLERAGNFEKGSITGLYTVLVEGDDMDEPIADSVRSIVDGHIVLSRKLAQKGHFPAIDVLQSASRVMRNIIDDDHVMSAQAMRENLAIYREAEDLINIGAYKRGSNAKIDQAIEYHPIIEEFLRQKTTESTTMEDTVSSIKSMFGMR